MFTYIDDFYLYIIKVTKQEPPVKFERMICMTTMKKRIYKVITTLSRASIVMDKIIGYGFNIVTIGYDDNDNFVIYATER